MSTTNETNMTKAEVAAEGKPHRLSAAQIQKNVEMQCDVQIKQYAYQMAQSLTPSSDENGKSAPPSMDAVLANADKVYQWFKNGTVPAPRGATIHQLN